MAIEAPPRVVTTHPNAMFLLERKTRFTRFRLILMVAMVFLALLVLKLVEIQFIKAGEYREKAKAYRTQSTILSSRGRILDRNGQILAQDVIVYDVYAHPRYYFNQDVSVMAKELAPILNKAEALVYKQLKQDFPTISLAKNLDKTSAKKIAALGLSGIEAHKKTLRRYPQGSLASHIIGYVSDEAGISTGVESTAADILRKMPFDMAETELTGQGDFVNVHRLKPEMITHIPKANDVELTIDSRIQYAAENALRDGLQRARAPRGTVVVMDPTTGEILAWAVSPGFYPEDYFKAKPEELKNWALTDVYPPGSTMKILTVAMGLETGVINADSRINDTGKWGNKEFQIVNHDFSKTGAPGNIDLVYLLQHSSNIASLKISLMMKPEAHYKLLRGFGFGEPTGIGLTGESAGILQPPDTWDKITHATMGYGYGLASTPLQMASAVSAIANDGVWITPHIQKTQSKIVKRRVISSKTAAIMANLLTQSIERNKTSTYYLPGYHLAGKTGTSRKPSEKGPGYDADVFTSFVGYFPAQDPKVLVMVVVDSPKVGNAWGSTIAGPIFHQLALQTAGYLGIKPDTINNGVLPAATAPVQ